MNNKKILFIVEGERDGKYAKNITEAMGLEAQVFRVKANIYMLYNKLKKDDFQLNITDTLLEMKGVKEGDKEMLRKESPFLYTYLIFDMDPQHSSKPVEENIVIIKEMLGHFCNETDNTIGKLYINYPMLESLWDYDKNNMENYKGRTVGLQDLPRYKAIVGERGTPKNISRYTLSLYNMLSVLNTKKAMYIITGKWQKPSYEIYLSIVSQLKILDAVNKRMRESGCIYVCNSLIFFMIDYWGNTNGFYDSL